MKPQTLRSRGFALIACGCIGAGLLLSRGLLSDSKGASPALVGAQTSSSETIGSRANPARVLGLEKANCKKCHASEVAAWMKTKHYKADDRLSAPKAKEYASAMGINAADLRKNSLCLDCHGTKTANADGSNVHALDYGVSCSSCHGGSGGEDGWLNPHGSFHETKKITSDEETPAHRKMRIEKCEKAGMIRPARLYQLAKNCYSCHIVSNEKLVNAGHPAMHKDGFELVEWSSGEVRHNFQRDQKTNNVVPSLWAKRTGGTEANRRRMKFLVGILVDLEAGVRNLSKVAADNGKTSFAKFFSRRVLDRKEILEAIMEAFGDDVPEEIAAIYEAVDSIKISKFNFKGGADAKKALPIIEKNAKAFAEKHDGSKLAKVDSILKDVVAKPRGKVFQPAQ
ncbi:MAG: multiheme c-type cytochrome [Planctomycetaceae bacterium]